MGFSIKLNFASFGSNIINYACRVGNVLIYLVYFQFLNYKKLKEIAKDWKHSRYKNKNF
jgi:hypothetical protein